MTRPDDSRADDTDIPPVDESQETKSRFAQLSKIPAHLPGGLRTTTAGLVLAFLMVLLLWNAVRFDPTMNENSPVYVPPAPSTPEVAPTQQFTPTRTPPTTSPFATTPDTTAPDVGSESGSGPTAPATTTATTAPGFQLPTIPGLPLPGQATTTTPQ